MTLTARAVLKANRLFHELPESAIDKLAALAIRFPGQLCGRR